MKKLLFFVALLQFSSTTNAQQTNILNFADSITNINPKGSLFYDGTFLYGTTCNGGKFDKGTIYKIRPDETGFETLLDFNGAGNGSNPESSLISDGTYLYGMTPFGGTNNKGTVFKIKPDGTNFIKLKNFDGSASGSSPYGALISVGNVLYGMTTYGGTNDFGTIFKLSTNGGGFVKLMDFNDSIAKGSYPRGAFYSDGTFLYGTTLKGGIENNGTIFKIKPDGTGFVKLMDYNNDWAFGVQPSSTLISDGTFLYGTTTFGGNNYNGAIFKVRPDGTDYNLIMSYNNSISGNNCLASLFYDGTFLYGTTSEGGGYGKGTLFKIRPDGTAFSTLINFNCFSNGCNPLSSIVSDGTYLYGTTNLGGSFSSGIIYKIQKDGTAFAPIWDFNGTMKGINPRGSLISNGNFLYGMTSKGGLFNVGTLFKILPDGTGYENLLNFNGAEKGSNPEGSLLSDGTFLYGMTVYGGTNGFGTIFKIGLDGKGYVKLLDFNGNTNGSFPYGSIISDGTFLYGMTSQGGTNDLGTIFKIKPDGTGYVNLKSFTGSTTGSVPFGSLIAEGTFLYGMTALGGTKDLGTLFKIKPDGTGFANLMNFDGIAKGSKPYGSLVSDGTFLYGLTNTGGTNDKGTLFKVKPDGTSFSKLINFDGSTNGSLPFGSLISDGTFFYGMTTYGGKSEHGTMFKIRHNGNDYSKLLDFDGISYGKSPRGSLFSDGSFLYGLTYSGGTRNQGTIVKYLDSAYTSISKNVIKTNVSISPNPFSTQTVINSSIILNDASLKVYNSFGQIVKQINTISGQTLTLLRGNLPCGLYFISLQENNLTLSIQKLIITD